MRKFSLTLLATLAAAVSHAATVNWGASIDTGIIDSSNLAVTQGNLVRIGYFGSLTNAQVTANAQTQTGLSLLNADFKLFAQATLGEGTDLDASFSKSSSPPYSSLPGFLPASQIYFWATKSSNTSTAANALASVTQTAIAYVPVASNSSWMFPATDVSPAPLIDISSLSNPNAVFLAGSYKSVSSAALNDIFDTPNSALKLANVENVAPIPEPSTLAFGVLAAWVAAGSRRRYRK